MTVPSRLPIVQAPMAGGPSTPELAAAVNAAGGFGFVAAGYLSPDACREALARTRELTSDPIGVNLFVPGRRDADDAAISAYAAALRPEAERRSVALGEPRWDDDAYAAKLEVLISAGVHTASFTFGCPSPEDVSRLHRANIRAAVTVTDAGEAETATAAGADSLIVQGTEAGGHQGTFAGIEANHTPLHSALGEVRRVTDLPLVAAGGIMDAHGVAAARAAGAVAAAAGTAFMLAPEAATNPAQRALIGTDAPTALTRAFTGRLARGIVNRFMTEHPDAPRAYPEIHFATAPIRAAARERGDADGFNLWAGQAHRLAREEPAAETVRRLAAGIN
jgi:nitronate monooxygenase